MVAWWVVVFSFTLEFFRGYSLSLRKTNGKVWFRLNARSENSSSVICEGPIPNDIIDPILEHGNFIEDNRIGENGVETHKTDEPIIFLKQRVSNSSNDGSWAATQDLRPGIMLWLEIDP
jgi:hypothetical protein